MAKTKANSILLNSSLSMIYKIEQSEAIIEIGLTGTKSLQDFFI
jgi:hypothetical protein